MKEKIIETALDRFLKHGIKKMNIRELVSPMGISTKTVYKYFNDKEDLLKHCLQKHYSELMTEFDRLADEDKNPVSALFEIWYKAISADYGVNHIFYHDLNYYYPRLQDAVLHKLFRKKMKKIEDIINAGKKRGYFRKDIAPGVTLHVIGILYSSITRTGSFKKFKLSTDALMLNTIDAYLRGICTEKGLQEIKKNYSSITK